jgi:hypothetical protein
MWVIEDVPQESSGCFLLHFLPACQPGRASNSGKKKNWITIYGAKFLMMFKTDISTLN